MTTYGTCPTCLRPTKLTKQGLMFQHNRQVVFGDGSLVGTMRCPSSGTRPQEWRDAKPAERDGGLYIKANESWVGER